jgi:hypothetical protein
MNNLLGDLIIRKITTEMSSGCKVIDRLHLKGYNENFEWFNGLLKCARNNHYYKVQDFDVYEIQSIEDDSGILEGLFLFALRHRIEGLKGIILSELDDDSAFSFF